MVGQLCAVAIGVLCIAGLWILFKYLIKWAGEHKDSL